MKRYSTYFQTIHDQPSRREDSRRIEGFTVFRVVVWSDHELKRRDTPKNHTFAIVWDEDHDTRVIQVAEKFYLAGVLQCISMIYEHEGNIVVRLLDDIDETVEGPVFSELCKRLELHSSPYFEDYWMLSIEGEHPECTDDKFSWIASETVSEIDDQFTLGRSPIVVRHSKHKFWALEA